MSMISTYKLIDGVNYSLHIDFHLHISQVLYREEGKRCQSEQILLFSSYSLVLLDQREGFLSVILRNLTNIFAGDLHGVQIGQA